MAGKNNRRAQNSAIDRIDMTPLIDLTFLLLIVFIVTVPLMEYSADVSPPDMNADKLPEDKNNCTVSLNKDGKIIFNKKTMEKDALYGELHTVLAKNKLMNVFIRADGSRQYHEVIDIMRIVKNVGFKNVSLITLAEDPQRGKASGKK